MALAGSPCPSAAQLCGPLGRRAAAGASLLGLVPPTYPPPGDAPRPCHPVHRFHVTVAPGTKLESGPATLHLCNDLLVLARDIPPAVTGQWKLSDLRRYGAVPSGFIFEGGTRCGYCKYAATGPAVHLGPARAVHLGPGRAVHLGPQGPLTPGGAWTCCPPGAAGEPGPRAAVSSWCLGPEQRPSSWSEAQGHSVPGLCVRSPSQSLLCRLNGKNIRMEAFFEGQ